MRIVGALDVHRKQLTFDYVDTDSGQVSRGKIAPADRPHLAVWLRERFADVDDVTFSVEACTGWWYVTDELRRAGVKVHLAEPADMAAVRGRRSHAKTDRADARLMREAAQDGRIPLVHIPPEHVLECRALLSTYNDLRRTHTAYVQRLQALLFHHGAPALGAGGVSIQTGRQAAAQVAAVYLTATARMQFDVNSNVLDNIEANLYEVRRELLRRSRRLHGARLLQQTIYGVGPITAMALVCWLGGSKRFSSSRKAVRYAGLDITVYSSDGKRSPGKLSRQGPAVLRWCLYEAGKTAARATAPERDHAYYTEVKARVNGKRAALSQARRIARVACHLLTALGDDAFTITNHTSPAKSTARRTTQARTAPSDDKRQAAAA
jgi:transposase